MITDKQLIKPYKTDLVCMNEASQTAIAQA